MSSNPGVSSTPVTNPDGDLVSNLGDDAEAELDQLARDTITSCLADVAGDTGNDYVRVADTCVHVRFQQLGGCYRTPMPPTTDAG